MGAAPSSNGRRRATKFEVICIKDNINLGVSGTLNIRAGKEYLVTSEKGDQYYGSLCTGSEVDVSKSGWFPKSCVKMKENLAENSDKQNTVLDQSTQSVDVQLSKDHDSLSQSESHRNTSLSSSKDNQPLRKPIQSINKTD